ncbi:MAG: ribosome-associated protein [bacterium]|nr:MAG: ribosome-associated protein [bacterium]
MNEITNNETTNNEIANTEITNLATSLSEVQSSDKRVETLIRAISDKKATNIVILDLREIVSFTDYFILCSGRATRQVQAIADEAQDQLRKQGCRTSHIEGYQKAEWILMDYGDFVVHIFGQEAREFYDLERLWRDAKRTEIKDEQ